jgi:superoxide dismutase, Fe-Mn family
MPPTFTLRLNLLDRIAPTNEIEIITFPDTYLDLLSGYSSDIKEMFNRVQIINTSIELGEIWMIIARRHTTPATAEVEVKNVYFPPLYIPHVHKLTRCIIHRLLVNLTDMKPFEEKKFTIPELKGISAKSIEEHLGLYSGYVKNFNALVTEAQKLSPTDNPLATAELLRRSSFEFGGMRLHEYYFAQLEGGAAPLTAGGAFEKVLTEQFGSIENFTLMMKRIGMMRGPGWALLYWDPVSKQLLPGFSGEQHQGHLVTLPIVFALDVWEHTYILDQGAAGKGKYIDAFLENINWSVVEKNFAEAQK